MASHIALPPHPPPHPYHHGIPQPGTALALFSTHAPSGVVQHSMLLSIALTCHSKGCFAEIEHKRIVSVSKKKINCSIPVQLLL